MQWNFAEEPKYDSGIKIRKRCKSHKFIRMMRSSYDIKNLKYGRPWIDSKKREKKARNDLWLLRALIESVEAVDKAEVHESVDSSPFASRTVDLLMSESTSCGNSCDLGAFQLFWSAMAITRSLRSVWRLNWSVMVFNRESRWEWWRRPLLKALLQLSRLCSVKNIRELC